jgi:hypothetical protein
MPGYLVEKLGVSMDTELHPRHFALLRLAQLRQLKATRLRQGVYAVSSHSRRGHWHKVAADVCSCESVGYCTHLALVFDTQIKAEAESRDYLQYLHAQREDFAALELRVLQGAMSAEDKAYVTPLIERVRATYPRAETPAPAEASF